MGIMTFLAPPGLAVASFMFAFSFAGMWVSGGPSWSVVLRGTMLKMLFVIACLSLILIEPAAISPYWLQYTLLIGLPAGLGFLFFRLIVRRWSGQGDSAKSNH